MYAKTGIPAKIPETAQFLVKGSKKNMKKAWQSSIDRMKDNGIRVASKITRVETNPPLSPTFEPKTIPTQHNDNAQPQQLDSNTACLPSQQDSWLNGNDDNGNTSRVLLLRRVKSDESDESVLSSWENDPDIQ